MADGVFITSEVKVTAGAESGEATFLIVTPGGNLSANISVMGPDRVQGVFFDFIGDPRKRAAMLPALIFTLHPDQRDATARAMETFFADRKRMDILVSVLMTGPLLDIFDEISEDLIRMMLPIWGGDGEDREERCAHARDQIQKTLAAGLIFSVT